MVKGIFQLEAFGLSDVGLVREHNEDVWASFPGIGLFVLADGMGGHAAGEVAARSAVDLLHELVIQWNPPTTLNREEATSFFRVAFGTINDLILKRGQNSDALKGMGTTLNALYFLNHEAVISHVGDSRVYLLRQEKLKQLTEDHSLVSELLALGAMQPEDAKTFPYKHILTRAMGTHPSVEPTICSIPVKPNDLFLLCSDGLTNYVTDNEIAFILQENNELSQKGRRLIELSNKHGGGDNITLILVDVHDLPG